jgi:Cu(I)/Ag(I) efflux system membrane protein CusA/SilA
MLNKIIGYFLENRLVTLLILILLVSWGIVTAPFGWQTGILPSDPVPVDAIPDIGENQQIVFTEWKGRSPQDIDDQVTYPLTTWLLGIPGVKSVRSSSMFGFSSIFIIFDEDIEFYWSRSRILEKLSALPPGMLPEGVKPALGPDATALGQVFWYTIEGRDPEGNATGGWDLHEIRSVQDFYVKYGLNAASGVSEVASIGGYVKEYQVDVNPDALQAYNIPLHQVMVAVQASNREVGARTIEINQAEYLVRGLGYIKSPEDIGKAVVAIRDNTPVRVSDIGVVTLGPAPRRGALDKDGAGVVGGVVVARYGANPLQVINNVKDKIEEITPGMPEKILPDGTPSKLTIVPFYDRSGLIYETLGTLEEALILQIIIAILVVMVMVINLRASLLISSLLPVSVLIVFIAMRYFGVDANIVALSGIAIAIGTMVDLGIILSENVVKHINESPPGRKLITTIYNGAAEVSSAILTAVSTTIVSFIPVFTMQHAEGKLFGPLAFTKTFALVAALLVSLFILPALAHIFFGAKIRRRVIVKWINILLIPVGIAALIAGFFLAGIILIAYGISALVRERYGSYHISDNSGLKNLVRRTGVKALQHSDLIIAVVAITWLLAKYWIPLGPSETLFTNFLFVGLLVALILGFFLSLERYYRRILSWTLDHKALFISIPVLLVTLGLVIWMGFSRIFRFAEKGFDGVGVNIRTTSVWSGLTHAFPGIGKEFMPSLDEGSFLLMPTTMPHSGMELNMRVLAQTDMLVTSIPEVELTVGKLGRVESALDPAPISMFENVINYKPEYALNRKGHRQKFSVDKDKRFITVTGESYTNSEALEAGIASSDLVPDENGLYFRNWRDHIRSSDDIWDEIVRVTRIPGLTSAPKLQPIETRLVMLQTGMRAPMGIKVYGPDLNSIEEFAMKLESVLKEVPSVKSEAVFADRIVGKPYIHLNIDRDEISRYGLNIDDVQKTIETAIGGMAVSYTVEGRERFPVRIRYPRELRDSPEELGNILISTPSGAMIPLKQVVDIEYVRGPQAIKSEETFLVGYLLFDKREGFSEVTVVDDARNAIQQRIDSGKLTVPSGISYKFSGNYENQVRAEKRLSVVVPVVLMIIFLILYFQFKSVTTSMMIFAGIAMAFSGGFIMLWLYGQTWFADFSILGTNLRDLFRMGTVNLSVAVWVGFIALFGIATDDGVLMGTYLDQSFRRNRPGSPEGIREAVIEAGERRIKPAIMTSATTIIALLPVLTSTGRGSDIMIPMAIPAFGGMLLASITYFIVPVLYSVREERKLKHNKS